MSKSYDILVVGAGISGATIAERYATQKNKKVMVIDKRDHIAGNCYDFYNDEGILVPKYGPHFFHTNYEDVWKYVNKFSEWTPYIHKALSRIDGKQYVPIPVNIETVNKVFGLNMKTEKEMKFWLEQNTKKIEVPKNSEEAALRRFGKILYEKMFKYYVKKQWDKWPSELDATVIDRIPVRISFDDRYFTDKYQVMPNQGYTKIFENMFNNDNIDVELNTSFEDIEIETNSYEKIFFTGRIDSFFGDLFKEHLEYRSLKFVFETLDVEYFQPAAQVSYPTTEEFTRITEPKHSTGQKHPKTTIIKEFGTWDGEPYYPVPSERNKALYAKYKKEAKKLENRGIYFVGRLAEYKYFNMDQAFKNALDLFNRLENKETVKEL